MIITVMIVFIASSSILMPLSVWLLINRCENYTDSFDKIKFVFMNRLASKYRKHFREVQLALTEAAAVEVEIHLHIHGA